MVNVYMTQDRIGTPTGGGTVTHHEYKALESLGVETHPLDSERMRSNGASPFEADALYERLLATVPSVGLAHAYAGCFSRTVRALKAKGAKVTYTAAAHDIQESRREFEGLGVPFDFPHLTDEKLWNEYVAGYRLADLVVCPSQLSARLMGSYGCQNVVVIPHGCSVPEDVAPPPRRFTVGYLGQAGPDKGLRYLFEAWKKLDFKDATLLVAGNNMESGLDLWRRFGGGNIEFMGWVGDTSDFYGRTTVYCQPSVSEGFGIEVLEAMAHGRPVIVSRGAGAADVVSEGTGLVVGVREPEAIAAAIETYRSRPTKAESDGAYGRQNAANYDWDSIRGLYVSMWKALA